MNRHYASIAFLAVVLASGCTGIQYKEGYKYQLHEDYRIHLKIYPKQVIETDYLYMQPNGWLLIKKGYCWDGASGPTLDTKSSMRGSLVHDALYQLMREGLLEAHWRLEADEAIEEICAEDGMWKIRAHLWERALRYFGAGSAKRGTERPVLTAP